MASFANFSINDGQTTPVAHSFTTGPKILLPDGRTRYTWYDFSVNSGVPIGANRLDMDVRLPSTNSRTAGEPGSMLAVDWKFVLPTLETLSGSTLAGIAAQPQHAFDTTIWVKVVRNGRAGQQPVKDALAFMRNFSQLAVVTDTLLNYGPPTG